MKSLLIAFVGIAFWSTAQAEELRVLSWNLEGGVFEDAEITELVSDLGTFGNYDIYGFSEVTAAGWPAALKTAAEQINGASYTYELGTTSGDRLMILFNADKFRKVGNTIELTASQYGRGRAPLALTLEHKASGQELIFMVNHLHRGNEQKRFKQARDLNTWAESQEKPVIAVGDYNMDWEVDDFGRTRGLGFDIMLIDSIFNWVRPANIEKTICNDRFNSILDFVFVAQGAKYWPVYSRILWSRGCDDDAENSDHRPVEAVFEMKPSN